VEILHWLTVPTAAKRLGISNMSTYRAIEAGRIRVVETPLGILVDPASVEQYARTRRPVHRKGERLVAAS
jgi:excisionase family DNA binding protein